MNAANEVNDLSTEWRNSLTLYPLYVALAREFVIDTPPCPDLEAGTDAPSEEGIEQSRQWFATMDERIHVHQLRQFLQTTPLGDEVGLRLLLARHLKKFPRTPADRDKIDFLLVQFFSHATPSRLEDSDCDLSYIAQILEPVLGTVHLMVPDWLEPLDQILSTANGCDRLSALFAARVLEQGRKLKVQCGDNYFLPSAMIAFTRFSFLMRRVFFRLMHGDLNAILDGLRKLESQGITTLDCRRAHFSHQEPTDRLRMICHSWKVMFHAEYSSGQPLKMLADLRTVVEEVVSRSAQKASAAAAGSTGDSSSTSSATPGATKTKVTKFAVQESSAPEFDITAGQAPQGEGDVI
jgi:hypothetical protein